MSQKANLSKLRRVLRAAFKSILHLGDSDGAQTKRFQLGRITSWQIGQHDDFDQLARLQAWKLDGVGGFEPRNYLSSSKSDS